MRRSFLSPLLLLIAFLLGGAAAQAQPVGGLIVRLRTATDSTGAPSPTREGPQALRERMAAVMQDAGIARASVAPLGQRHQVLRFSGPMQGLSLDAAMRRLRLHPDVLDVEPDVRLPLAAVPNDPGYANQWYLQSSGLNAAALNMPQAWDRTTGGQVTVAVLDTGIVKTHPELAGHYWPGYDFVSEVDFANDSDGRDADPSDPGDWVTSAESHTPAFAGCTAQTSSWHGTFISGLVAAQSNNGSGIAGLNWNTMVLPVRVSGKCGALLSDILDGMRWAAGLHVSGVPDNPHPARIINLSFGGDVSCASGGAAYQDTIDEVTAAGSLVVVAAGNDGGALRRPADCRGVMAVAAVQSDGLKASYSNFGTNVALAAPGGSGSTTATLIYSLVNSGTQGPATDTYGTKQGTSFSAPMAAGVASLMLTLNPALTPSQLIARMQLGARGHASNLLSPTCSASQSGVCNCTTSTCGAGLLDGNNALVQSLNPVAIIAAVAAPLVSTVVALDGRASAASTGSSLVSYAWTQLSGATVTIANPNAALASVTLPAAAGSFVFKLHVVDSVGRTGDELLTFTSTAASSGGGGGASSVWWGLALWLLAAYAWLRRDGDAARRTAQRLQRTVTMRG